MAKKITLILLLSSLAFALCGCAKKENTIPIRPMAKVTMSAEREILFEATRQAWAGESTMGIVTIPTQPPALIDPPVSVDAPLPTVIPTSTTIPLPTSEPIVMAQPPAVDTSAQGFYQLQPGETPKCIARRFDIDWLKLYSMNNISFDNENNIPIGTVLLLPQNAPWNTERAPRAIQPHPADYVVQPGDTIGAIACRFGDVRPEEIAMTNNLTGPDQLVAGLSIRIP